MEEILIAAVIFFAAYQIIKLFSSHLLKRKLIKAEQYERVGILEEPKVESDESNRYPSLKWGLVALMTGLGFIIMEVGPNGSNKNREARDFFRFSKIAGCFTLRIKLSSIFDWVPNCSHLSKE